MSSKAESAQGNRSLAWIVLAIAAVVILVAAGAWLAALSSSGSSGYGWMMGGSAGWGWMWGLGALMMAVPLIFLVLLISLLLRPVPPAPVTVPASHSPDPVTVARLRFARGELTSDQFRQVLNDLQRS